MRNAATIMFLVLSGACMSQSEKPHFAQSPDKIFADKEVIELASAAKHGDIAKIEVLIESGVDINATGKNGITPLVFAMLYDQTKAFKRPLSHGANPDLLYDSGGSLIHDMAGGYGTNEMLRAIIESGANIELTGQGTISTPLLKAVESDSVARVKMLIDAGANIEARDYQGDTPLLQAATSLQWEIVLYLMAHGADTSAKNRFGNGLEYFFKTQIKNSALTKSENFLAALDVYCENIETSIGICRSK